MGLQPHCSWAWSTLSNGFFSLSWRVQQPRSCCLLPVATDECRCISCWAIHLSFHGSKPDRGGVFSWDRYTFTFKMQSEPSLEVRGKKLCIFGERRHVVGDKGCTSGCWALVSKAGDQMEVKTRRLDFPKARKVELPRKFSHPFHCSPFTLRMVLYLHNSSIFILYFSRGEATSGLSSMMFWRMFSSSLLLKEEARGIVSWSKREGCVCISGSACTCQKQLRQRNNPHKISCTHKPYNNFWNSCHRSDLSIKKKNQNRNLRECTESQIRLTLLGFHSANNFCTISHFWTFTDYQKRDKNIFYDRTP